MNEQLTDQVLIERIQNGDKQAFNLLVVKYQNKVCNLISRYVNNQSDVADVAQETFIK
ncbi:sigma factor, partial [Vibrio lentus]